MEPCKKDILSALVGISTRTGAVVVVLRSHFMVVSDRHAIGLLTNHQNLNSEFFFHDLKAVEGSLQLQVV
jgi:hypothetical protein